MATTTSTIERQDGVVLANLSDWNGDPEAIEHLQDEWVETASQPGVVGSVTVLNDDLRLGSETQDYIADTWTELVETVGHDRAAYVVSGITGMAVKSNIESSAELEVFESVEAAKEWVREV